VISLSRRILCALVLVGAAAAAAAHVRLVHPANAKPLRWGRPSLVSIVFNATGSDDIADRSHLTALRLALAEWNDVEGTLAHVTELTSPALMARSDWASDDLHMVLFDEDDSSGYFPPGSGTVALTPVWFGSNGVITDADILFNGADHRFTTSGVSGRFDVQDVMTHELGHFLGLDHSGWAGATMFPYVDPSVILHRSLASDEHHGLRAAYPEGAPARITGFVRRAANQVVVEGAHVVARDAQGRTVASVLCDHLGAFTLAGLAAGSYELVATPFEGPVTVGNLGAGHPVETDFEATVLGTWSVDAGEELDLSQLYVESDVPLELGRPWDDYPLRAIAGQTRSFVVRGMGLGAGSTLEAADAQLGVVVTSWLGTQVTFQVTTPAGAAPGHVDLLATNAAGQRALLVGALEITPRDPNVVALAPTTGQIEGGTLLTISGSRFNPGSRVVIGPALYRDGDGSTEVVDDTTIRLTTRPTPGGEYDVVVIDPSGVEDRLVAAFQVASIPVITAVFPPSGSAAGGTELAISGQNFEDGCSVALDGVVLGSVVRVDAGLLRLTTQAHPAGGPYVLEVTNPLGASAQSAYVFAAAPDPVLAAIEPASGGAAGGESIVLHGANFDASCGVVFGADPETGLGGTPAQSVTWIDAATLEVVTPRHASGAHAVLVRNAGTGQAVLQPAAFTFTSAGGGGGCSALPVGVPRDPRDGAALCGWFALVLVVIGLRRRRLGQLSAA